MDREIRCLMCRMCNAAEETVFHIVSECRVHAQTEYKGRHNKLYSQGDTLRFV